VKLDLDELEAVAKAATQDGWHFHATMRDDPETCGVEIGMPGWIADFDIERPEDAIHCAAFDPPTALALIAEIRRLRFVDTEIDRVLDLHAIDRGKLEKYGDHSWKCAVSRQLRADVIITNKCDCGWQEIARAMLDGET
jgi:hypothetical protein